ncbi:uncharacterized protein METZ01_LOCUS282515 [marine metagenome]|uniref:Uncharacterized protein n=1 Tax=marine metagenome TaxID=408172 RepID=A0A382L450_9ZZZZ
MITLCGSTKAVSWISGCCLLMTALDHRVLEGLQQDKFFQEKEY